MNRVVIGGGGPGGYEAALVAAQLDAEVTVIDRDGLGGPPATAPARTCTDPSGIRARRRWGWLHEEERQP